MSGSRSAAPLAAAWAVAQALGVDGYTALTARCVRATRALRDAVDGIEGLRVVGAPAGPLLAVTTDEDVAPSRRVDPHLWADAVRSRGWVLQPQPGLAQDDGTRLPHTTHLTVTPVTETRVDALVAALVEGADEVRGATRPDTSAVLGALTGLAGGSAPSSDDVWAALRAVLGAPEDGSAGSVVPSRMAPLMAIMESLPAAAAERLLVELLARVAEPVAEPVAGTADRPVDQPVGAARPR
ncbi:hypothetical protein BJF88_09240 [Cellulosimicrobium sp. CUA-896]|nr:hypothetical protein BJF88_09240 [Cellulosimicrobium sp. CUA-896]